MTSTSSEPDTVVEAGPGFWILDLRVLGAVDHTHSTPPRPHSHTPLHAQTHTHSLPPPPRASGLWIMDSGFPCIKKGLDLPSLASIPRTQDPKIRKTAQSMVEADHTFVRSRRSRKPEPKISSAWSSPSPPPLRPVNLEITDPGSWIFTKLSR